MGISLRVKALAQGTTRKLVKGSRLIRSPTEHISIADGETRMDISLWGFNERNTEILETHLGEQLSVIRDEGIKRKLSTQLECVEKIPLGNGHNGKHRYNVFTGIELLFAEPIHPSTICHEFGHAIASASGYFLTTHGTSVAEDYSGEPPNWDFAHTSLPRRRFMLSQLDSLRVDTPGLETANNHGLDPTRGLTEQDWLSADPEDVQQGDYVTVNTADGTTRGRVLTVKNRTSKVRTADGGLIHVDYDDSTVELHGYIPGFPTKTDTGNISPVRRLMEAVNRAWYRMTVEQEVGIHPVVVGYPYSMTNAHETMAKTHELFQGVDTYRRIPEEAAPIDEEFPSLTEAYKQLIEIQATPVVGPGRRQASGDLQPRVGRDRSAISVVLNKLR